MGHIVKRCGHFDKTRLSLCGQFLRLGPISKNPVHSLGTPRKPSQDGGRALNEVYRFLYPTTSPPIAKAPIAEGFLSNAINLVSMVITLMVGIGDNDFPPIEVRQHQMSSYLSYHIKHIFGCLCFVLFQISLTLLFSYALISFLVA